MDFAEDFTVEEKELAARVQGMESMIDDMLEIESESADLLKLGAITERQVTVARKNLADAQIMLGISQRRLDRMVEKRRTG